MRLYCWCGSMPIRTPRGSATRAASASVYRIRTWSSSTVVHAGLGPSSVLTTGAPHSAAKRTACLRYSTLISGLHSGQCALNPESFTPAASQARVTRRGSSSIETLWK